LLGALPLENPELALRAAPLAYVTPDDPPFLIQHGDADELVPLEQSELFEAALKSAKVAVDFDVFPGAGHGGPAFSNPANLAKIAAFFQKHLN
jgi:dipeptidyl aminopeptidase/acylaminoacyl peptidase